MGRRSDSTVPQRRKVVMMLLGRKEAEAKLARRFGVSEHTLHRWRDDFLAGGEAGLASGKGQNDLRNRPTSGRPGVENPTVDEVRGSPRPHRGLSTADCQVTPISYALGWSCLGPFAASRGGSQR